MPEELSERVHEQLDRLHARSNVGHLHFYDMQDIAQTFDGLIREGERLPVDAVKHYIDEKGASERTVEWFGYAAEVLEALHSH